MKYVVPFKTKIKYRLSLSKPASYLSLFTLQCCQSAKYILKFIPTWCSYLFTKFVIFFTPLLVLYYHYSFLPLSHTLSPFILTTPIYSLWSWYFWHLCQSIFIVLHPSSLPHPFLILSSHFCYHYSESVERQVEGRGGCWQAQEEEVG